MISNLNFHHIGIATKSLKESTETYKNLGFSVKKSELSIQSEGVKVSFLHKDGHPLIELIEPTTGDSPINNILNKNGSGPYHLGYFTKDIRKATEFLKENKYIILRQPQKSIAFDDNLYFFAYRKDIGLIEIIENPE